MFVPHIQHNLHMLIEILLSVVMIHQLLFTHFSVASQNSYDCVNNNDDNKSDDKNDNNNDDDDNDNDNDAAAADDDDYNRNPSYREKKKKEIMNDICNACQCETDMCFWYGHENLIYIYIYIYIFFFFFFNTIVTLHNIQPCSKCTWW